MTQLDVKLTVRIRRGRLNAMMQQASGELKRAPRRERPALLHRWAQRMAEACCILEVDS